MVPLVVRWSRSSSAMAVRPHHVDPWLGHLQNLPKVEIGSSRSPARKMSFSKDPKNRVLFPGSFGLSGRVDEVEALSNSAAGLRNCSNSALLRPKSWLPSASTCRRRCRPGTRRAKCGRGRHFHSALEPLVLGDGCATSPRGSLARPSPKLAESGDRELEISGSKNVVFKGPKKQGPFPGFFRTQRPG